MEERQDRHPNHGCELRQIAGRLVGRTQSWLSGEILTSLNKLVLPAFWMAAVVGFPLWVLVTTGRLRIRDGWEFIFALAAVATILLLWLTVHLQRVGHNGRELIVANYWRSARIPFHQVGAVEPVWWYWRRMVRIRFGGDTPFGSTVYYIPKWAPIRCLFEAPERELQGILSSHTPAP